MDQRESLESLRLEIDMLKGSKEGRVLLLGKGEYFQARIDKED